MKQLAGVILFTVAIAGIWPTAQATQVLVRSEGEFAGASFPEFVMNDNGDIAFLVEGSNSTSIYTLSPGSAPQLYASAGFNQDLGVIRSLLHYSTDGTVLFWGLFRADDGSGFYPGLFKGENIDATGNLGGDTIHDCLNGRCDPDQTTYADADYEPGVVMFIQAANRQPQLSYRSPAFCSSQFNLCTLEFNGDRGLLKAELTAGNQIIWIDGGFSNVVKQRNLATGSNETPQPIDFSSGRAIFDRQGRILFYEGDAPPSIFRRTLSGITAELYNLADVNTPGQNLDDTLGNFTAGPADRVLFSIDSDGGPDGDDVAVFFDSERLNRPLIAEGHVFEGELLERLSGPKDGALDSFGQTVVSARWGSNRGLLLADGSTDFAAPGGENFFWSEPAGGSFGVDSNWEPQEVPGNEDAGVFDLDASYSISTAGQSIGQLKFDRGGVTFSGDLQLTSSNLNAPSVQVGFAASSNPGGTQMLWTSGQVLAVNTEVDGSAGETALRIGNPGTSWINQNRTAVANGTLSIEPGASFSSGSIAVSDLGSVQACGQQQTTTVAAGQLTLNGRAFLDLVENVSLDTGNAVIGLNPAGEFDVSEVSVRARSGAEDGFCMFSSGPSAPPDWTVDGDLLLGASGTGLLQVTDGGTVSVNGFMSMGVSPGGNGTLTLSGEARGLAIPSTLNVQSSFSIGSTSSAEVLVDFPDVSGDPASQPLMVGADAIIGSGPASEGLLRCVGNPDNFAVTDLIDIQGLLTVGANGSGSVEAHSCLLTSGGGRVGASGSEGTGTVSLSRSIWRPGQDGTPSELNIGLTDTMEPELVQSRGTVTITELGAIEMPGTINIGSGGLLDLRQGAVVAFAVDVTGRGTLNVEPEAVVIVQKGPAAGNSIEGNLNMTGGRLEIGVNENGEFGSLTVNGNVDLSNTQISLRFPIGYAPSQGELRTLIDATGTVNASGLTFSYIGMQGGFAYTVTVNASGDLEFEALNDGAPFLSDEVFESSFEDPAGG